MIKHYLKIALRSLGRQKLLAMINISGLSIGLACFLLFLLYSVNEFNYDRFHTKAGDIYRVYRWTEAMNGDPAQGDTYLPMPLGPAFKNDVPDVVSYVRMQEAWGESFARVGNTVSRLHLSFADPSFFSVFSFPILAGNSSSPLHNLNDIVITEKIAKQYFGNDNPVGRSIDIKFDKEFVKFTITAVAKNIPSNSTLDFEVLGNYAYLPTTDNGKRSVDNWRRSAYQTYVQLQPGSKLASQPERLLALRQKYYPGQEKGLRDAGYWKQKGAPVTYGLQPLLSIHTDTRVWGGSGTPVEAKTIWILLAIAAGVLLIACINFTTLAIGRSASRAREIGIRKVVGSLRSQLTRQFLAEALLLTVFSVLLGFLISTLLLPWFNELSGKSLRFSFRQFPELIWLTLALTLVVGLIAGSYPALVLSRFKVIEVLKQKIRVGGSNFFTRALVTFQFVLSIGLMACTLIMIQQITYMTGKNPGFSKDNVLVVDASGTDSRKLFPLFKQAALAQPAVAGVAGSELGLGEGTGWSRQGFDYNGTLKQVFEYFVDPDYIPVMGMQLLAGRNFDRHIAADTVTSVIVNEAMVKDFGWTIDNAVGQQLKGYSEHLTPVVIGVVKDFNFQALRNEVKPQLFHQFSDYTAFKYAIRLKPGDPSTTLSALQKSWASIVPDLPFKYSFLDEDLNRFYDSEVRWGNIIGWAGGISIFLACLGLFGLAALAVVNRTKEIGIRKVLGASVGTIVNLLAKDFLKLVLIALIVATPIAWYFMYQWLQDFVYRISIGWWIFVIAGSLSVFIAFVTIGVQAIRAGLMNPVKSLRSE